MLYALGGGEGVKWGSGANGIFLRSRRISLTSFEMPGSTGRKEWPAIAKELHTVDGTSQCAKAWNMQKNHICSNCY